MAEKVVTVQDGLLFLRRHLGRILSPVLIAGLAGWLLSGLITPRYKAKAVLNIQSSYFRNPLVSDLVPEVTDPGELSAQRQSLLRLALDDQFLDELGDTYKVFKYPTGSPERTEERGEFLKTIEYFALNPTTFQISALANSGRDAAHMVERIVAQITRTLVAERYTALMRARDAIAAQVKFLSRALRELSGGGGNLHPDYLEGELERLDEQINNLRKRYTENHPEVFRLKGREAELKGALDRARKRAPRDADEVGAFVTPSSKAPVQDIYNDLLKKLSHLSIVLSMERDRENLSYLAVLENPAVPLAPFSPKRLFFLLGGLAVGFIFGLMRVARIEYARFTAVTPTLSAEALGVPLLGVLQPLNGSEQLMLDAGGMETRRALPR
ncbi:MAG: hypothetical protein RL417_926 [Pseudomonadota bacterium]|jgi:uncharacterized protein involved in exopolysaccharide biosynthesis